MSNLNDAWVLADVGRLSVFNFYPTRESAEADNARANADGGIYDRLHGTPHVYEPMLYADFCAAERNVRLSQPAYEITEDRWYEMLEMLPPMKWKQQRGWNSFLNAEMQSGVYTHQYVRVGSGVNARWYEKLVDSSDLSTWIGPEGPTGEVVPLRQEVAT